jgi:HD-like signal output (HDOD) protein
LVVSPEKARGDAFRSLPKVTWEASWVPDAKAARALLERERIDVVLADGDAPVQGEDLLQSIRARLPHIAVVALAGKSVDGRCSCKNLARLTLDRDLAADKVAPMLERAFRMHTLLTDPRLLAVVGPLEGLPAVPQTYWALTRIAADPNCTVAQIAAVVESDPAISLRVLQMVNSAFFGLCRGIASITQAVAYLGIELLKSLVLTAHVFAAVDTTRAKGFSLERFQLYSVRTARLAKHFMGAHPAAEDAFAAAIVHDIGELVLAIEHPAGYGQVLAEGIESPLPSWERERRIIGAGHPAAGAVTLSACGIPFSIVECVAFHHTPREVAAGPREVLAAVHAADALVGIMTCGDPESSLDLAFLESAGVLSQLPGWRARVEQDVASWT